MAVIEWVAVGTPIVAMVGMFGMMLKVLGGLNKRFGCRSQTDWFLRVRCSSSECRPATVTMWHP